MPQEVYNAHEREVDASRETVDDIGIQSSQVMVDRLHRILIAYTEEEATNSWKIAE